MIINCSECKEESILMYYGGCLICKSCGWSIDHDMTVDELDIFNKEQQKKYRVEKLKRILDNND